MHNTRDYGLICLLYKAPETSSKQLWLDLFSEEEKKNPDTDEKPSDGKKQKVGGYTRSASSNQTLTLPADTPVEDIYHDDGAPICDVCDHTMSKVGEFVQERIAHVPSYHVIIRHHYAQYRCENCLSDDGENALVTSQEGTDVLNGTICDPSLLAYLIVAKMGFGLPLYRLEHFYRLPDGQSLSRQLISSWLLKVYAKLHGLEEAFHRRIYQYPMINMDETFISVINSSAKLLVVKAAQEDIKNLKNDENYKSNLRELLTKLEKEKHLAMQGFLYVRSATQENGGGGLVVYDYDPNRTNEVIDKLIGPFSGFLMSDGLVNYTSLAKEKNFTHGSCLVHAAREPKKILEVSPHNELMLKLADMYQEIFRTLAELDKARSEEKQTDEEFLVNRRKAVTPLYEDLEQFCKSYADCTFADKKIAKAIKYPLKRTQELLTYLDYPYSGSTNNEAERKIRRYRIGANAFLFCNSIQGAHSLAFYYSVVESCRSMKIDPEVYLTHVLLNAHKAKTNEEWDALLPGVVNLESTEAYLNNLHKAVPDPKQMEMKDKKGKSIPYYIRGKAKPKDEEEES